MKTNKIKLALLATAVAGVMFSSAFANGTGTTATGTTATGVTNTGTTHTGVLHEMRDARHELRDLRHAGMTELKALCADLKEKNSTQSGSLDAQAKCKEARKAMKADIKEKAESIRKVLSVKLTADLNAKLDAIPAEKMETVYNKLIERIDTLIARAKSERVKVALQEVQAHVEVRLALLASDE